MSEPPRLIPTVVAARAASARRWSGAFGARFFLALVVGLIWLGPAWWDGRLAYGMLAWNALILLAWFVDYRCLPAAAEIATSRIWPTPVSLGVATAVVLEVVNHAAVPFHAILYDDTPPSLRCEPPQLELDVPRGKAQGSYLIKPRERGDVRLGRVFIRYRSAMKLAERWATADLDQTIRVYPNLEDPKRHTLYLIRSRQIDLEKRRYRQPGRGREFESMREYRPSDEPRDICWTATARFHKLITKVYSTERSQAVFIVVDGGRLMLARIGTEMASLTKLDAAVNAALTLAHVALFSGDRVGVVTYGRKPQARVPAARGAAHLRLVLEGLALARGELVEASHATAANVILSLQSQRGLVVWLTDLAETATMPEVIESASRLRLRHLVLFVAMGQPQLKHLVATKPESHEEMYRYAAALDMTHRREMLLRQLREQGVMVTELSPDQLATRLVDYYLRIKERGLL